MGVQRRHNIEGAYARGEETRRRIVSTAIGLFGEHGFDGVSVREIAAKADVPPPSLQYYFGAKEGLYDACFQHIEAAGLRALGPALAAAEALLEKPQSTTRLIEAYWQVLDRLVDFLLRGPEATKRAVFMFHYAQSAKSQASRERVGGRMWHCFTGLVVAICGYQIATEDARLIAAAINGQLFAVYLGRSHLKLLTGWDSMTPSHLETLKRLIREQTIVLLESHARRLRLVSQKRLPAFDRSSAGA
ncbi:MAG TPA: CerR family C-terminal domain-containing protein [Rhizomicrobium sp.]|nr:CerR family C-terminal domain-containing protein [Rhizomicrobium sp.]